jgi:hypothetical protein
VKRAGIAAALVALCCVGCSGQPTPRDDRATVRSDIEAFGKELVQMGYVASSPAVYTGECKDAHWATVKWSASVIAQLAKENQYSAEQNVLARANQDIKLDVIRFIQRANDNDPAQMSLTSDHATVLTITVPKAEYVRVDGYASC